jgi:hypothetical protein
MEIRIGVTNTIREVELEVADDTDVDALKRSIEGAVTNGGGMLWLTDRKGRQVGVHVEKLAYVDIGSAADKGRIGFGG